MSVRDRIDIISALRKKGFIEIASSDHDLFVYCVDGKKTGVHTIISRGSGYKTYGDSLLGKMKRQLKLTSNQLLDLIDCPLEQKEYHSILKSQNIIKD